MNPDPAWLAAPHPSPDGVRQAYANVLFPGEIADLPDSGWDFLHMGSGCRLLSPHVFAFAAEWGSSMDADMVFFSSPEKRLLTRHAATPGQCFQVLGEMGRLGLLYATGNKFFSRKLLSRIGGAPDSPGFLTKAFSCLDSILVFSHPWVEVIGGGAPAPDGDFELLAERYALRQEGRPWT